MSARSALLGLTVPAVLVSSFVALAALGACLREEATPPDPPPAAGADVSFVVVDGAGAGAEQPTAGAGEAPAAPASPAAAFLAVVDRAGALHLLSGTGAVLATRPGRATDVVSRGATIATFEPATGEEPGAVRIFTMSGSTLHEEAPRSVTSERGGLVGFAPGSETIITWEEAERASLLMVDAQDAGGVAVGVPASVRWTVLGDGAPSLEVLVTASGAPRIDRFRVGSGGQLRPADDFAVPLPPDVEARMVGAPDGRLLISLEAGAVRLRDEMGGEEAGPSVGPRATLEDTAAYEGRLALLLGNPAALVRRDLDGVYITTPLPEHVAWDPRPSHRLALDAEASFVIAGTGLVRMAWPAPPPGASTETTATAALEPWLADAVAVVVVTPE